MISQQFDFIPKAWSDTKGAGVSIALFDTGAELSHLSLKHLDKAGNKFDVAGKNFNPITNSGNDNVTDGMFNGNLHGTQMAGVISAISTDTEAPQGVAVEAELLICKMRDANSESYADYFIKGLQLAILKKVDIISCAYTPTFKEPFEMVLIDNLFQELSQQKILLITTNANTANLDKLNALQFPSNRKESIVTATLQDAMLKKWNPTSHLNAAYPVVLAEKEGIFCGNPAAVPPHIFSNWKNSHATAALAGIFALYLSFLKNRDGANYVRPSKDEVITALKTHTKAFIPDLLMSNKTQIFYHQ